MEEWRDVPGYEGRYKVSCFGRVYSKLSDRLIALNDNRGYTTVRLYKGSKITSKRFLVHRLVAEAFIPNPDNLPEVNHKDKCKQNNYDWNLEWCTTGYNQVYSNGRPVVKLDSNGNSLKLYMAMSYVSEDGYDPSAISSCCGTLGKSHGYSWRYATEEEVSRGAH